MGLLLGTRTANLPQREHFLGEFCFSLVMRFAPFLFLIYLLYHNFRFFANFGSGGNSWEKQGEGLSLGWGFSRTFSCFCLALVLLFGSFSFSSALFLFRSWNIGCENKICMNFFPRRGPSSGKIWFFWKQSPPLSANCTKPAYLLRLFLCIPTN